jgi:hypothetical protein
MTSTPRTHAHTHSHILPTWGTNMKAQGRHNAYTDQTQTVKPVFMSDTTASLKELIALKHAAVPHDAGVKLSLSSVGQDLCGMTRVTGH